MLRAIVRYIFVVCVLFAILTAVFAFLSFMESAEGEEKQISLRSLESGTGFILAFSVAVLLAGPITTVTFLGEISDRLGK